MEALKLKISYDSVTLINCHLQSGNSKDDFYKRIEQLKSILVHFDNKANCPLSFVFGDMNFRCDLPNSEFQKILLDIDQAEQEEKISTRLAQFDQLRNYFSSEKLNDWNIFEEKIAFLPSYKLIPQSGIYNCQQSPSWYYY